MSGVANRVGGEVQRIVRRRGARPFFSSGTALFATFALAFLALSASEAGAQNYRTVVIFGDTQTAVNGGNDALADFQDQIDWVIANKHTENIDFVMHVGDIIDTGTFMPLPSECVGAPPISGSVCSAVGDPCNSPPNGCFSAATGAPGGSVCLSCSSIRGAVDFQWSRFNTEWSRLEPDVASGWEGMPYAIVRGNHDNIGASPPNDLDVAGFNQYYSSAQMEALETAYVGFDRDYEHLETFNSVSEGNGNAWRFTLGGRPVLVVGPSYEGGQQVSQTQINWAINVFGQYPDMAGVLLAHDTLQYSDLYHQIVQQAPTVAPNLFLSAKGHVRDDTKVIQDFGGVQVMRTVSDWSRTASPGGSYFAILRFYFEAGQDDEAEAFTYSPVLDTVLSNPITVINKQPFQVPEPSAWCQLAAGVAALIAMPALRCGPGRRARSAE